MKIRLIADDSKMPNIAIMKISTYHKSLGDNVMEAIKEQFPDAEIKKAESFYVVKI